MKEIRICSLIYLIPHIDRQSFCLYSCDVPNNPPSCPPDIEQEYSANDKCGMIKDTNGLFQGCIEMMEDSIVQGLFEDCIYDVCASENKHKQLCEALTELMEQCYEEGYLEPIDWRNEDFCPCKLSFKNK